MIQLGIDIATFISINGAVISYVISQRKSLQQSRAQYSTTDLVSILGMINDFSSQYDSIGNKMRFEVTSSPPSKQTLDKYILETIIFLEILKREFERQSQTYFPLHTINEKSSAEIFKYRKELDALLEKARKGKETAVEVSKEVEPLLKKIERSVVLELKKNMKNG